MEGNQSKPIPARFGVTPLWLLWEVDGSPEVQSILLGQATAAPVLLIRQVVPKRVPICDCFGARGIGTKEKEQGLEPELERIQNVVTQRNPAIS